MVSSVSSKEKGIPAKCVLMIDVNNSTVNIKCLLITSSNSRSYIIKTRIQQCDHNISSDQMLLNHRSYQPYQTIQDKIYTLTVWNIINI